jgi:hypothetical protein
VFLLEIYSVVSQMKLRLRIGCISGIKNIYTAIFVVHVYYFVHKVWQHKVKISCCNSFHKGGALPFTSLLYLFSGKFSRERH